MKKLLFSVPSGKTKKKTLGLVPHFSISSLVGAGVIELFSLETLFVSSP